MRRLLLLAGFVIMVALLAGQSAAAQEGSSPPVLDFRALAARFLGYSGGLLVPELSETPALGDQLIFRVPRAGSMMPVEIRADLVSVAPEVYVWAETGLEADLSALAPLAPTLQQAFSVLAMRENYAPPLVLSGQGAVSQPNDTVPVPDVDNDPHLHILLARDLGETADSFVRTVDSLPAELVPGGLGNSRELIVANTAAFPGTPLSDPLYLNLILGAYQDLLAITSTPSQAAWLRDALALAILNGLQGGQVATELANAYLDAPDTPLFGHASLTERLAASGGQQLFLAYLAQRFGGAFVRDLWHRPGEGTAPLEAALQDAHASDLVSAEPVDVGSVFADFTLANLVNAPIGDGRYQHAEGVLQPDQGIRTAALDPRFALTGQTVQPFGTDYYRTDAEAAETVTIRFSGSADAPRMRLPADQPADESFYWSGRAPAANATLTRSIDLNSVDEAALSFDVAHDLSAGWDYGYVSVSEDGGATWTILPATTSSADNRHGFAYGPGFTGISNPEEPRPFPVLGVVLGADGITLVELVADGPAAQAGLRVGDQIIGHHGKPWDGPANVLELLADSQPGDTVPLLIRRNDVPVDVPVVVGAHPTRRIDPEPIWQSQIVDLAPYAGKDILLRFETVMQPGQESGGLALRNLAIDAIGWADDGTGEGWTLDGWTATTNSLPQQWLVQAVTTGTAAGAPTRVIPLIGPGDAQTSGEWPIALQAGESLFLVVSAVTAEAARPATYDLALAGS